MARKAASGAALALVNMLAMGDNFVVFVVRVEIAAGRHLFW